MTEQEQKGYQAWLKSEKENCEYEATHLSYIDYMKDYKQHGLFSELA